MNSVCFAALAMVMVGLAPSPSADNGKHLAVATKPAPAISFSAPADESSVTATIPVRATASDVEIKGVTFLVDGVEVSKAAGPAGTFKWDTTKFGDGWHTLTAVAKDASGKATEADVAVMVHNFVDKSAPKVAITWPMDGDTKSAWKTTRVHTSDNIAVTSVETYLDGKLVASSNTAPFDMKWKWNKLAKGNHTLQVKAYDSAGNSSASSVVTIAK